MYGLLWHRLIKDNGIGFDMRFHDRIFTIFQRLQRAEDFPGTGVGLGIVHKAVQRMAGRVWAESAPGQGATFHVQLPRWLQPATPGVTGIGRDAAPAAQRL